MRERRGPTSTDIARRAGVTRQTVYKALTGRPGVSPGTAERIITIANEAEYRSRDRKERPTSTVIAIVAPHLNEPLFTPLIPLVHAEVQQHGYQVATYVADSRADDTKARLRQIEQQAAGIILIGAIPIKEFLDVRRNPNVPIVAVNAPSNTPENNDITKIEIAHADGLRQAVTHLIGLGHRRIAFMGDHILQPGEMQKLKAYERVMQENGLEPNITALHPLQHVDRLSFGWHESENYILAQVGAMPTAIVTSHDEIAIGVIRAAREKGLRVPDDLSVVGFGDIPMAEYTNPSLTTIEVPRMQIAYATVNELLIQLGKTPRTDYRKSDVAYVRLLRRESTCPAPRS